MCFVILCRNLKLKSLNLHCLLADRTQPRCNEVLPIQRRNLVSGALSLVTILVTNHCSLPSLAKAEEQSNGKEEEGDAGGIVGAIVSLFDPNEETKTGKLLPKAYLKSARDVVKNLRESLKEDTADMAKFRRAADSAKEAIREYLSNWRGQQSVAGEESYAMLEKAIRSLAGFYSKAGPSAVLPEEVKTEILNDLNTAEEFL